MSFFCLAKGLALGRPVRCLQLEIVVSVNSLSAEAGKPKSILSGHSAVQY